jgi:hypothetical protein
VNIQINSRTLRQIVLVIGLIGLLTVSYGLYRTFDATSRYNALPEPRMTITDFNDPAYQGQAMLMLQLSNDRKAALRDRDQATSIIGVGAVLLGAAVILYMRLPDQFANASVRPKST